MSKSKRMTKRRRRTKMIRGNLSKRTRRRRRRRSRSKRMRRRRRRRRRRDRRKRRSKRRRRSQEFFLGWANPFCFLSKGFFRKITTTMFETFCFGDFMAVHQGVRWYVITYFQIFFCFFWGGFSYLCEDHRMFLLLPL